MSNFTWKINAVFMPASDKVYTTTTTTVTTTTTTPTTTPTASASSSTTHSYAQQSTTVEKFIDNYYNYTYENDTESEIAVVGNRCILYWTPDDYITVILFCIIFCLSVVGNSTVIIVILKQRIMRSITNIFLLNLAVADLLLSVICMPPTLLNSLCMCWQLGHFLCKLFAYLQPVSVAASAYTLAMIALERYNAICRPLKSRSWQTRSHAYKLIAFVWLIAFVSNVYLLFMYNSTELQPNDFPGRLACVPDSNKKFENFAFQVYLTVVLLIIPLFMMIVLYGCVIHSLRASLKLDLGSIHRGSCYNTEERNCIDINEFNRLNSSKRGSTILQQRTIQNYIGQKLFRLNSWKEESRIDRNRNSEDFANGMTPTALRSTHSIKAIIAKQHLIRMLVVIVIVFFCCWTPNFIYWLIQAGADYFMVHLEFNPRLHMGLVILCYLSSCTNPITYCFLNKKFRTALMETFGCHKAKPMYLPMVYLPNASPAISQISPNMPSEPPSKRNSTNETLLAVIR